MVRWRQQHPSGLHASPQHEKQEEKGTLPMLGRGYAWSNSCQRAKNSTDQLARNDRSLKNAGAAQAGQSPRQSCFEGCETSGTFGFPSPGYQHQVKKRCGRKARWTWHNGKGSAFADHQAEESFVMPNLSAIS